MFLFSPTFSGHFEKRVFFISGILLCLLFATHSAWAQSGDTPPASTATADSSTAGSASDTGGKAPSGSASASKETGGTSPQNPCTPDPCDSKDDPQQDSGKSGGLNLHYLSVGISAREDFDINPTPFRSLTDFTNRFISFMTGIVVLITILVFMTGSGFWIFSAGNESLVERGKTMMTYSIIGILCVLGAYVITQLFQIILYIIGT